MVVLKWVGGRGCTGEGCVPSSPNQLRVVPTRPKHGFIASRGPRDKDYDQCLLHFIESPSIEKCIGVDIVQIQRWRDYFLQLACVLLQFITPLWGLFRKHALLRSTLPRFHLLLFGQVLKFLCSPACNENSFCGDFCSLDTLAHIHGTVARNTLSRVDIRNIPDANSIFHFY